MPLIAVFFFLLPVLEIISIVLVSRAIGLGPMLMLLAAFFVLGVFLIRMQSFSIARKLAQSVRDGIPPQQQLFQSGIVSVAGVLFMIPGFFSSAAGLLLLLPPVQMLLRRNIGVSLRPWQTRPEDRPSRAASTPPVQNENVIDVEFTEVAPKKGSRNGSSPWKRPETKE